MVNSFSIINQPDVTLRNDTIVVHVKEKNLANLGHIHAQFELISTIIKGKRAEKKRALNIVLDLEHVHLFSLQAVREIARVANENGRMGGELIITGANDTIKGMLALDTMCKTIPVCATPEEAEQRFNSGTRSAV